MRTPTDFLYLAQERLGLTGPEARAAVILVLALAGGLLAQTRASADAPEAPRFYASADAAFLPTGRSTSADSAAAPLDSVGRSPADAAERIIERSAGAPPSPEHPVDINAAPRVRLEALPGIGPVTAARIAEARPFRDLADLQARVRGIGPKKAEALAPVVTF